MTEIPAELAAVIKSGDLRQLKVFCTFYRNKWDAQAGKFAPEATGVDISSMIQKAGTLSKTLDISEVSRFEANNMVLTLSDVKGLFNEGTPNSIFSGDYQIYGSYVNLYVGISQTIKTQLFTGVIKELPTYKPDDYQLDLRLVSPLELLNDIEAKDFSNTITGETLTLDHPAAEGQNPFYQTSQNGVGGFNAIYANGIKLFEGVDYEVTRLGKFTQPALVEIINSELFGQTFTADYYVWHTNLATEEIISGLLQMAGYAQDKLNIQPVTWNSAVRSEVAFEALAALDYKPNVSGYVYSGDVNFWQNGPKDMTCKRSLILPPNFDFSTSAQLPFAGGFGDKFGVWAIGDIKEELLNTNPYNAEQLIDNGVSLFANIGLGRLTWYGYIRKGGRTIQFLNTGLLQGGLRIKKIGTSLSVFYKADGSIAATVNVPNNFMNGAVQEAIRCASGWFFDPNNYLDTLNADGSIIHRLSTPGILTEEANLGGAYQIAAFNAVLSNSDANCSLNYRLKNGNEWGEWQAASIGNDVAQISEAAQAIFAFPRPTTPPTTDVSNISVDYLANNLRLQLVNLAGQSVLQAIEDFALISSYEFGLDRFGDFFFRPRLISNTPIAVLDGKQLVKIGNVQKKMSNFFTKLVLTFGKIPLEFYADQGDRPNSIDRYGVLTKEIDKPQIVNYDNPELAKAIGPQLLEVYSSLKNQISATAKLNLSFDLGDVVNFQRELSLTVNPAFSDYTKYENLNTFYRACKIIGLTYDFSKWQVKYTLQDVSSKNTKPLRDFYHYQTVFPTPLDYKE